MVVINVLLGWKLKNVYLERIVMKFFLKFLLLLVVFVGVIVYVDWYISSSVFDFVLWVVFSKRVLKF